jgi:surface antigen
VVDLHTFSSLDAEVTAQTYPSRRDMRETKGRKPAAARTPSRAKAPSPKTVTPRATVEKAKRKNPLSVLATMAVVGGMFAVAGLPAYAMNSPELAHSEKTSLVAQSLNVSDDAALAATTRDAFHATTPEQLAQANEDALRAANNAAYNSSGAREMGDDYPWAYELTDDQGGGLSPLNYYFRECVDFVAWRINRDQGYYAAPFKWVWSNLTPYGGNGGQWQYNWESLGRTISATPIVGAVAYTGGNHVAYVKSVNADGTVTLEEYNYVPGMYSQRTIPASSVTSFLYPPS